MNRLCLFACVLIAAPSTALATPGLDEVVYGATVEAGKTEVETRYGRLMGDSAGGEDALVFELAHGFSRHFYGAALAHFERAPSDSRRLESLALEGIVAIGRVPQLDLDAAVYVEAEHNIHGPDNLETKLLLQHRKGRFDGRLNLIAERALTSGAPIELGYAASADYEVAEDFRLGAEAFGDVDTTNKFTTRGRHLLGPAMKLELEGVGPGEVELRAGYLFPVDRARNDTTGQLRLGLEYEF